MSKTWTVTVESDPESDDLILPLPADLLAEVGWNTGDKLAWLNLGDGRWQLTRSEKET